MDRRRFMGHFLFEENRSSLSRSDGEVAAAKRLTEGPAAQRRLRRRSPSTIPALRGWSPSPFGFAEQGGSWKE